MNNIKSNMNNINNFIEEINKQEPILDKYDILFFDKNNINMIMYEIRNLQTSLDKYYFVFEWITNIIIKLYKNNNIWILEWDEIIYCICNIKNGYMLLNKLKNIIKYDNNYIIYSCLSSNLKIFLFWYNNFNLSKVYSENDYLDLIICSIKNNKDDRILDELLNNNKILDYSSEIIEKIITNLVISKKPKKYILRKMKILSKYISLSDYFKNILHILITYNTEIIPYLFKYYKYELDIEIILMIYYLKNIKHNYPTEDININDEDINIFIDLNSPKTIDIFKLNKTINKYINIDYNNFNYKYVNILIYFLKHTYCNKNIQTINKNNFFKIMYINYYNNNIINYLLNIKNQYTYLFNIYDIDFVCSKMLYYTKYYIPNENIVIPSYKSNEIIKINKLLSMLRIIAKKYKKNKMLEHKAKWYDVLNEIKKRNNKTIKHKYNINYKPYTLFQEIYCNKYLIREIKSDIIVTKKLFNKYNVLCEYDETQGSNGIYYVLDIDIENMDIIDRYIFLRKLHPLITDYEPTIINTFEDFIKINNNDNLINKNKINWFPKVACIVNNELSDLFNYTLKGSYSVRLSFINNDNSLIIKPKNKLSINLLYTIQGTFGKWIDNDNNEYNVISNDIILNNNMLYSFIKNNNNLVINKINYWDKYPDSKKNIDLFMI